MYTKNVMSQTYEFNLRVHRWKVSLAAHVATVYIIIHFPLHRAAFSWAP